MSTLLHARRELQRQLEDALRTSTSSAVLVDVVIRSGWQPRPVPEPDSDYLEGRLDDGTRVPIEIRHRRLARAH